MLAPALVLQLKQLYQMLFQKVSPSLAHPGGSACFISLFYGHENHSPVLLIRCFRGMSVHF